MAKIIDLSDDPIYTIKNVASKTGIRPVTLRAWERRHEVLNPHRAGNRYRLYSERDVAILKWIKNRVDQGISISNAVSELRSMIGSNLWPEALPTAPEQSAQAGATPPSNYAGQLYEALIRHDENRAGDLLRSAHSLFDLLTVCTQIFIPTLRNLGEAWYRGEIRISTEHFASVFLRGKLLTLLQAYPARRNAPKIIIGCAPTEQHELGGLMLAVLLRSQGYRVEYLGPDIPLEDLADYARDEQPNMVILSAVMEDAAYQLRTMQALLQKTSPTPLFGFGGRAFDLHDHLRQSVPGHYLGNTLEAALEDIPRLLHVHRQAV